MYCSSPWLLWFSIRSISVGVDQWQVKDSLTLLSLSGLQPVAYSCHPSAITGWSVCLFYRKGWGSKWVRWLGINQVFSYKCDRQECESAEAEMCCFSSVITLCHRVICSRLEGKTVSGFANLKRLTLWLMSMFSFQELFGVLGVLF